MQDVLAPKKFTSTIDSVAVSEEMFAEGMVEDPTPSHPHAEDIVSAGWGSYFYYPLPARQKVTTLRAGSAFLQKAPSFDSAIGNGNTATQLPPRAPSAQSEEMKRAITLRRVSSMRTSGDIMETAAVATAGFAAAAADARGAASSTSASASQRQRRSGSHCAAYSTNVQSEPPSRGSTPSIGSLNANPTNIMVHQHGPEDITSVGLPGYGMTTVPASNIAAINEDDGVVKGPKRINTLWGTYVRDYAQMCIPDIDVLVDYPIDYEFPRFYRDKHGEVIESGFFPSDPISLHADPPHFLTTSNPQATSSSSNVSNSQNNANLFRPLNTPSDSSNSIGESRTSLNKEKE